MPGIPKPKKPDPDKQFKDYKKYREKLQEYRKDKRLREDMKNDIKHLKEKFEGIPVKSGGIIGKKSGPPPKSGPTPHGMKRGGIATGCGKVMGDRRKVTKYY
tara:strand:+ start:63 stop:368 length:306 start_codon:yes stop_codon:yes gene_type:complete